MMNPFLTRDALSSAAQSNTSGLLQVKGQLLKKLQDAELEILSDLILACYKYDISLMVGGGTLLGTVRHHGFIPWDDDIDMTIPRSQVEAMIQAISKCYGNKYSIQYITSQMHYNFIKVRKNGTRIVEVEDNQTNGKQGIYIDVFIIENIPDNDFLRNWFGFWCNFRLYISTSVEIYENKTPRYLQKMRSNSVLRINYTIRKIIGFLFSWKSANEWYISNDHYFSKYKNIKTNDVSVISGRGHFWGQIFPSQVYEEGKMLPFESLQVKVPYEYQTYLKKRYGQNYMDIPPESKQEHHYIVELEI